ncbi:beta-ketoacyl-ACP synthase II [Teredinibacter turnerae]|uniref:3-oxoacyl-[acyl-carrier-protein] synthase 2 n=1 Tax=Teredinibacter turnerae (strain ATCC 39867 / T7901) TaxID=377629 RepID=C5BU61_TERTT|nr:beta-ketoacyl-ACP synthase II [Teredinibacter turnerae]ACR10987.1 3-oxoacyl-[acyl-carrier-protein] synthase II [Teredinibacter turnerae T7901]
MSRKRVVVTGLGMVSSVGHNVEDTWQAILAGKSGVSPISSFDVSSFATQISASVRDLDITPYLDAKEARKLDLFIQYGMAAGVQAMTDSGLQVDEANAGRYGCVIGSGIGGLGSIEDTAITIKERGPRRVSPFFVPGAIINMIAGNLSIRYGLKGMNLAVTTACTSATHSIGLAAREIMYGNADVMLAGGAEMATTPVGIGGFAAARALSKRNDSPEQASRPWDKDRDGFVLGDGAGIVVLEEYEHAKARGANIYAELSGFGTSGDAYHITSPSGEGAERAMLNTLQDANISADKIDYINAHGTSTLAGDNAECVAIKNVFGDHAYKLAVSSTKSMIGHLLGAAGAVEAIFSILSLRDQVAPPTINLDNPDEGCDLNFVPHTAQAMKIETVLSNSFGFGGTNGTLLFRKV